MAVKGFPRPLGDSERIQELCRLHRRHCSIYEQTINKLNNYIESSIFKESV